MLRLTRPTRRGGDDFEPQDAFRAAPGDSVEEAGGRPGTDGSNAQEQLQECLEFLRQRDV